MVAALHKRYPCGLTAYDCFASKIAGGAKTFKARDARINNIYEQMPVVSFTDGIQLQYLKP